MMLHVSSGLFIAFAARLLLEGFVCSICDPVVMLSTIVGLIGSMLAMFYFYDRQKEEAALPDTAHAEAMQKRVDELLRLESEIAVLKVDFYDTQADVQRMKKDFAASSIIGRRNA